MILSVDAWSSELASANRYRAPGHEQEESGPDPADAETRALRHALAEHDLKTYRVVAGRSLTEQLAG